MKSTLVITFCLLTSACLPLCASFTGNIDKGSFQDIHLDGNSEWLNELNDSSLHTGFLRKVLDLEEEQCLTLNIRSALESSNNLESFLTKEYFMDLKNGCLKLEGLEQDACSWNALEGLNTTMNEFKDNLQPV
ncbi:MAG: hypothetical protein PHQ23_11610 [Candidatus Wallbacteria bacterium]|nr:hypothetical protein [Candidatus Wallbacteria bacterium]